MITSKSALIPLLFLALAIAPGCAQSDFAGNAAAKKETKKKDGEDPETDEAGKDAEDGPDGDDGKNEGKGEGDDSLGDPEIDEDGDGKKDGELEEDDETILKPQQCTTANIKFAVGTVNCPKYYAAYTIDDGKQPNLGCCPLPIKDILGKEPGTPKQTCAGDEVATGTAGGSLVCTKINTAKYKLAPAKTTCYVGSGASGGSGAGPCGAPNVTLQALVSTMGSDACIGSPFGSLITSYTGKNCGDTAAAQLLYVKDGQPVPMNLQ